MARNILFLMFVILCLNRVQAQSQKVSSQVYEKAMEAQNVGSYKEAIYWYTKAIKAGGYELSYYNRAECYFQTGQSDSGLADLKSETIAHPNYARAWAKLGFSYFIYNDTSKGIDELRHALELDSLDYFSWMAGGLFWGYNEQLDSMTKWNQKALDLLIDSNNIDDFYRYYNLFNDSLKPSLGREGKNINREYNLRYASYISANQSYLQVYYYNQRADWAQVLQSMKQMFESEIQLQFPRRNRLYLAFNYFSIIGVNAFQTGNYEGGKLCLDYQFEIAKAIRENIPYAKAWANQGYSYYSQAIFDSALVAYRVSESFFKKEPFDSAISAVYSTIGLIYNSLTQYDSAETYAKKALQVCSKNDLTTKSICLNNLGMVYLKTGDFKAAESIFREALEYAILLKDTSNLTLYYSNLGIVYQNFAEFDVSEKYFLKALSLNGNNHPNLATIYNNLSYLHVMWGNFPTALDYCNKAMKEALDNKLVDKIGMILNNLSMCYRNSGNYEEGIRVLHESIKISEQLGALDNVALGYNNLALFFSETKNFDSATYYMRKALQINLALNRVSELGMNYDNIGTSLIKKKEYDSAIYYIQLSIDFDKRVNRTERLANHYSNLGTVYLVKEDYVNAEIYFKKTIQLLEEIRKTATGVVRREYLAQVIFNYQILALVQMRLKQYENAFETMELSKAKLLGEQLSGADEFKPVTLAEVQKNLDDSTAIYFFSSMFKNEGLGLMIDKRSIVPISFPVDTLLRNFKNMTTLIPDAEINLEEILKYYRSLLLIPKVASRGSTLLQPVGEAASPELREKVSRLLFDYFFGDLKSKLSHYNTLIIVPDGAINFLPFESLLDSSNHYLAERVNIGYVQSLSIEQTIAKREYSKSRKSILAFGGANYNTPTPMAKVQTKEAREVIAVEAAKVAAVRGALSDSYNKLGYGSWSNLPGTRAEVEKLKKMFPSSSCDVYEGALVNEKKIKELSESNQLMNYKVIHFATHGMVVPEVPELSALVLSQAETTSGEDNYLRADEISKLRMKADFVALSACETGLGKIYKGDGVVGLTQSFMIAGANSLAVSLWQVADASTSEFMTGIYSLSGIDNNYLKALSTMKRKFISGAYGEIYKAPYFWAPFVYYGKFHTY